MFVLLADAFDSFKFVHDRKMMLPDFITKYLLSGRDDFTNDIVSERSSTHDRVNEL